MNAATARQQGLGPGDVVVVESPYGSVEAPVYPHPMMPPWVVSMPLGRGQEQGDSYARGRGANPFSILAPMTDGDTGALAWAATRVRVRKTGRRVRLLTFEGVVPAVELPGAEIIRVRKG
jgi:anaerobic selenocysteine-containing dehydrogenase